VFKELMDAMIEEKEEKKLKAMGAKDSKELTAPTRERLFLELQKVVKSFKIIKVQPEEIDLAVESEEDNLNWLEAKKSAEIINELKPDIAYVDCPSVNTSKYADYIYKLLKCPVKIIAEHKADANYPIVSAASILAKVTRDSEIEKLKLTIGEDFGSGYPSDPKTKEFLKKNYKKYPKLFRKSWSSWKDAKIASGQKSLGEF